ncbi:Phosphate import ATP-binding protein PstB 3 [Microbacterium ginsengisoli]|uniref:Phosphate import ATP-binding protein PstB 3 n=1 Tax=Microbacterium ginsengisoli TaxID=400772 RepID=A0A0F0LYC1_9MICO|nr:Phosphate import ATP-binding protein PstB 3 [Microbacterium ginsengisoli]
MSDTPEIPLQAAAARPADAGPGPEETTVGGPSTVDVTRVVEVDETVTEVVSAAEIDDLEAAAAEPSLVPPGEVTRRRDQRRAPFLGRASGGPLGPPQRFVGGAAAKARASAVSFLGGASATRERLAQAEALTAALVPPSRLEARSISAWFGDHLVLQDVSLQMPAGQITALIGPSGCGKSTFLRILNRMHELVPSAALAGEVLLDADDIYDAGHRLVDARKKIGMVFQKPNPFPAMSIYDNVVAGLKLAGVGATRSEKDILVESCLTKAGLWNELKDRLRSPGGGLSGGQQQRLCIARSLAVKPRILLMDEPCSALDPTSTRVIEETMLELAQEVTIVIVTHNMQQAQRVSQQCAFFLASQGQPGHIVEHGDTEAMFGDPIDPRTHDYVNGRFG